MWHQIKTSALSNHRKSPRNTDSSQQQAGDAHRLAARQQSDYVHHRGWGGREVGSWSWRLPPLRSSVAGAAMRFGPGSALSYTSMVNSLHPARATAGSSLGRLGVVPQLLSLGQDGVHVRDGIVLKEGTGGQRWTGPNRAELLLRNLLLRKPTCSNLMFTVKSPASKFSRIRLQTDKMNKMRVRGAAGTLSSAGAGGHSHQHGAAHQDEEVEALLVGEQGVPDADDVRQEELLGQQQGEPAEGEVLRFDVLLFLSGHNVRRVG